jgi:hypothetical protein
LANVTTPGSSSIPDGDRQHVYTLCYFGGGQIVPDVELFEAFNDEEAILLARSRRPALLREIWERHRLVGRITDRGVTVA